MFILNWYREYLTIKADKVCQSCETLRAQLAVLQHNNEMLMNTLFKKPEVPAEIKHEITVPKTVPWNVRKQMLEREDRERARLMRESVQPDSFKSGSVTPVSAQADIQEFEKELKEAEKMRERMK